MDGLLAFAQAGRLALPNELLAGRHSPEPTVENTQMLSQVLHSRETSCSL